MSIRVNERDKIAERRKEIARTFCTNEIGNMAMCMKDRSISVLWACKKENNLMNQCLLNNLPDEQEIRKILIKEGKIRP